MTEQASQDLEFDEIGYWSELKLDIIRKYATAYATILARQPGLSFSYIDGFAGTGVHVTKESGDYVAGSPLNALRPGLFVKVLILERHRSLHVVQTQC